MTTIRPIAGLVLATWLVALSVPFAASAKDLPVDVELVLAVDISGSISPDEAQLQRQGYIAAFRSSRVLKAVRSGALGSIAVAYVEWAHAGYQKLVLPWTVIYSAESAGGFADALARAPISQSFGTSMSAALLFSLDLFEDNGYAGERRAIDLSANGANNKGLPVRTARNTVITDGVTINGLPIMIHLSNNIIGLDFYFEDCVIGAPGAFEVPVKDPGEFAATIERKLVLEISSHLDRLIMPIAAEVKRPLRMDCMAGEKSLGRLLPAE